MSSKTTEQGCPNCGDTETFEQDHYDPEMGVDVIDVKCNHCGYLRGTIQ